MDVHARLWYIDREKNDSQYEQADLHATTSTRNHLPPSLWQGKLGRDPNIISPMPSSLQSQDQSLASGHIRNLPLQSPPAAQDVSSNEATLQSLRVGVLLAISCDTMH